MERITSVDINNEQVPSFTETKDGNTTRFSSDLNGKEIGAISVTLIDDNTYEVGALFVDPTQRGLGIGSALLQEVNAFLERNNSIGKLVNMVKGDAASIYENNNWMKGEYKSQGAYGGYEYVYDGKKDH